MSTNQIVGAETLAAATSPLPPSFMGNELATESATQQSEQKSVEQGAVRQLFGAAAPAPELSGSGFTYRQDWGNRRGQWILQLNWDVISPVSRVLVAIAEGAGGGPDSGKFIGSARYTLHNVAPRDGGVDIWVNIEWEADIPLYVDYLIINP